MSEIKFNPIGPLVIGIESTISWSSTPAADSYALEISYGSYSLVYEGSNTSYQFVPVDAPSVQFRVRAYYDRNITWNEFDSLDYTWDELDALDWTWAEQITDWAYSGEVTIYENLPPDISGEDSDLGTKYEGFAVPFTVSSIIPSNTIHVVATLDEEGASPANWFFRDLWDKTWDDIDEEDLSWDELDELDLGHLSILLDIPYAIHNWEYLIEIPGALLDMMDDGSRHIIRIYATDNYGYESLRTYTFTRVTDLGPTLTYYVLRDGVPVAKVRGVNEWTDYMEVGTHEYQICAIDANRIARYSEVITATIKVMGSTLAMTDAPEDYATMIVRRDQSPQISRSTGYQMTETRYIGREYPVFVVSGQKNDQVSFSFSSTSKAQFNKIRDLITSGEPLVYRNHFEQRVIGMVPNGFNPDMIMKLDRASNGIEEVTDFSAVIIASAYEEAVTYD